jgi:hypothetical protein
VTPFLYLTMAQLNVPFAQQGPVQHQSPQQRLTAAAAYAARHPASRGNDTNEMVSGDESDGPELELFQMELPSYQQQHQHDGRITGQVEADRLLHTCLLGGQTCLLGSGSEGKVYAMNPARGSCGSPGCSFPSFCAKCRNVRSIVVKLYKRRLSSCFNSLGSNVFDQLLREPSPEVVEMRLQGTYHCECQLRVGWQHPHGFGCSTTQHAAWSVSYTAVLLMTRALGIATAH